MKLSSYYLPSFSQTFGDLPRNQSPSVCPLKYTYVIDLKGGGGIPLVQWHFFLRVQCLTWHSQTSHLASRSKMKVSCVPAQGRLCVRGQAGGCGGAGLRGLCVQVEKGCARGGIHTADSQAWGQETHALCVRWANLILTFRGFR